MVFPGMHWCLAYADMRHQVIYYLDALGGNNQVCQDVLLEYLRVCSYFLNF
jgi:Ulp1 family protease